ncbi:MAG: hypothetical protein K2Q20_07470, partial [Phycisphaerales bacterium]|nr:hypothetical protein [Phycisphaerales bacterium]
MPTNLELPVERVCRVLRVVEQVHNCESNRVGCLNAITAGLREVFEASVVVIAHARDDDATRLSELYSQGWRDDTCRTLLLGDDPASRLAQ